MMEYPAPRSVSVAWKFFDKLILGLSWVAPSDSATQLLIIEELIAMLEDQAAELRVKIRNKGKL